MVVEGAPVSAYMNRGSGAALESVVARNELKIIEVVTSNLYNVKAYLRNSAMSIC